MSEPHDPASSTPALPKRANLEHLKKQAKARLAELRLHSPAAQLAEAQLDVARANGFPSWRSLKAAFDHRDADTALAVGDWIGHPEGGLPLALAIRSEGGRLRAQLDVPALGYFGDPVEALSVSQGRMSFRVTVRGVNALFDGAWDKETGTWRGRLTHDGRSQALDLRRGVFSAPRVDGLDGLWDGQGDEGTWLTFRIVTERNGTFAWLSSSALAGCWFQVRRIERTGAEVTLETRTLRVQGRLGPAGNRIQGCLTRPDQDSAIALTRREPGAPPPWPSASTP